MATPRSLAISLNIPVPILEDDMEVDSSSPERSESQAVEAASLRLPVLPSTVSFPPRIAPETLASILSDPYQTLYAAIIILDARSLKEFIGGHIQCAKNIESHDVVSIMETLFQKPREETQNTLVVCHCEFSSRRGPDLAAKIRDLDRKMKENKYPELFYPELYVLDGGYCRFFHKFPRLCAGGYVKMEERSEFMRRMRRCQSQRLSVSLSMPGTGMGTPRSGGLSPVDTSSRDLFETVMLARPGAL